MADLFNRGGADFGGSFSADSAAVTFSAGDVNDGGVGLLTQNMQVQYQQQITRMYEIGTQKTFYVVGRAQGTVSMGRVLGPRTVQLSFYQKYGDACKADGNNINFGVGAGCEDGGGSSTDFNFTLKNCVITSIGFSVAAQDMIINESLQMMFVALEGA